MSESGIKKTVKIPINDISIEGELCVPENSLGLVLFAHGSGSSRFSPRNAYVAKIFNHNKIATLLVDLLTWNEDIGYNRRFDIDLLTQRLIDITKWLRNYEETSKLQVGYFGSSTGAAAAIKAAADQKLAVSSIVSRGGRVDLASPQLSEIVSPTLLIVGEKDEFVIEVNELAYKEISCEKEMSIIPGATHLFEEPGALDEVAVLSAKWFIKFFKKEIDIEKS